MKYCYGGTPLKLNYQTDVHEGSHSARMTPGPSAQRLPFWTTSAGHYLAGRNYFTEREGMENSWLLFYTLSGRGRLSYRDRVHDLEPGTAAIINCSEYQCYATASDIPWDFKWMHISGAAADEYEARINKGSLTVIRLGEACKTVQALDSILFMLEDKPDYLVDIKICHAIMEIMTELTVARSHPAGPVRSRSQDMEGALAYIRAHYAEITGIDEIIACAHISKFHFLRLFKSYTGQGLYAYLCNCRVDAAKQLLKGNSKVGAVAREVGFKDVNCFIRYFKKVTGVTPAVFQKYYLY